MKVNEFIEEYNKIKDDEISKKEFLCQRKTSDYVLFEVKVDVCEKVLDATNHEEVGGVKVWRKHSAYQYIIFTQQLLGLYTDIEFADDSFMADFNALNKEGLIDELINIIPEKEFNEFQFVMGLCSDDLESNERNIMSLVDGIGQIVSAVSNADTSAIEEKPVE